MVKKLMFIWVISALTIISVNAQGVDDDDISPNPMPQQMGQGYGMGPGYMSQNMGNRPYMQNQMGYGQHAKGMKGKMGNFDMPAEMEGKILEIIKKNDPSFYEKLTALKSKDERKYNATLMMAGKFLNMARLENEPSLEKDVVKGTSLEYDIRELSLQYDKAPDSEKAKIKETMRSKLNDLFEIRNKIHEIRIKKMEQEINNLKTAFEKRKANKSKIVEQRLERLTEKQLMDW